MKPAFFSGTTDPFIPASRNWHGNMCGIRIPGLPAVDGGSSDTTLLFSPFYDRYTPEWRTVIRANMKEKGFTHWLMSWPDSQYYGFTPQQFKASCQELKNAGFTVGVMLSAKPFSSSDIRDTQGTLDNILLVLPLLIGVVPIFCLGWELSLWLSPEDVQWLTDQLYPIWTKQKGTLKYVHFQAGYFAYQPNGQQTGAYWQAQVANPPKIDGVFHQRNFDDTPDFPALQARIVDCLQRFAGDDNCPADCGTGKPFDYIELEITAMAQFFDGMSESVGDQWAAAALSTPPVNGPFGPVGVMGTGN